MKLNWKKIMSISLTGFLLAALTPVWAVNTPTEVSRGFSSIPQSLDLVNPMAEGTSASSEATSILIDEGLLSASVPLPLGTATSSALESSGSTPAPSVSSASESVPTPSLEPSSSNSSASSSSEPSSSLELVSTSSEPSSSSSSEPSSSSSSESSSNSSVPSSSDTSTSSEPPPPIQPETVTATADMVRVAYGSTVFASPITIHVTDNDGSITFVVQGNTVSIPLGKGRSIRWTQETESEAKAQRYTDGTISNALIYHSRAGTEKPIDVHFQVVQTVIQTADELRDAVNALPSSPTVEQVDSIARQLQNLNSSAKRRVSKSTIRTLSQAYYKAHGWSGDGKDLVNADTSDVSSSREIDEDRSYAYGVSASFADGAQHTLQIEQKEPSGDARMRMELSNFKGPVWVTLTVGSGINLSTSDRYDYYMRTPDGNQNVSVESSRRITFLAPCEGAYKLYRERDDDYYDDDDRYHYYTYHTTPSTFWNDVSTAIRRAASGARVRVSLGGRTSVPADVLRTLQGRPVTLALYESNGNIISVDGLAMKTVPVGKQFYSVSDLRTMYDQPVSYAPPPVSSSQAPPQSSTPPTASQLPPPYTPPPAGTVQQQVTPRPTGSSSSSSESSSEESEQSSSEDEVYIEPTDDDDSLKPDEHKIVIQEPIGPQMGGSDFFANLASTGSMTAFVLLIGITTALGGGLLTHASMLRKRRE